MENISNYDEAILNDTRGASRVLADISVLQERHFREHDYLTRTDVTLAIAAVLEGRRLDNIQFAYPPKELLAVRSQEDVTNLPSEIEPFGSDKMLVIPIMLDDDPAIAGHSSPAPRSPDPSAQIPCSQAALVVASIDPTTADTTKHRLVVSYYRSLDRNAVPKPNLSPYKKIAWASLKRWAPVKANPRLLEKKEKGSDHGFEEREFDTPMSITSPDGFSTARIQLVLNAWAYIYDDPVASSNEFQVTNTESLFFSAARTMVSLHS